MGMGYGAAFADVVKQEKVESICRTEFQNFKEVLEKNDLTIEDFAAQFSLQVNSGDTVECSCPEEVIKAYKSLQIAFLHETGLEVELEYHNKEDEGDRYDDVDGAYWSLHGLYELTPAAKKFGETNWVRSFFVHFG
jgi:hypothetical protein